MQNTFIGFTPQVQKEIEAINEREEIETIVNASFESNEKRIFNTFIWFVCGVFVVVPALIHYI